MIIEFNFYDSFLIEGPKKSTVRDFWHMLWQENVGKVVMVTQLIEGKRVSIFIIGLYLINS